MRRTVAVARRGRQFPGRGVPDRGTAGHGRAAAARGARCDPGPVSTDDEEGPEAAAEPDRDAPAAEPPRAVFRPSPLVVLVAFAFAFCATPFAFGAPLFWLIYLVPLGMIVWSVRTRTVVDPEALTVRRVWGGRTVPWSQVRSLRLTKRTRVRAVLDGGTELTLPAVHVRNLPQISAASGGRLPDPTARP